MTRFYVLFNSSFRYDAAPNISHETIDQEKTLCGRRVKDAATFEPDDNDLDPDCIVCRRAARRLKTAAGLLQAYRLIHAVLDNKHGKITHETAVALSEAYRHVSIAFRSIDGRAVGEALGWNKPAVADNSKENSNG